MRILLFAIILSAQPTSVIAFEKMPTTFDDIMQGRLRGPVTATEFDQKLAEIELVAGKCWLAVVDLKAIVPPYEDQLEKIRNLMLKVQNNCSNGGAAADVLWLNLLANGMEDEI